jgi:ACR3 family arsenite efflux pump ArsB
MRNAFKMPYAVFFYSGVFALLLVFTSAKKITDIHIHDTLFVVTNKFLLTFLAIAFLFYWIVYVICSNSLLSKVLVWMHYFMMVIPLIAIIGINKALQRENVSNGYIDLTRYSMANSIIIIGLLFSVLLFLVNIIGGAMRKIH